MSQIKHIIVPDIGQFKSVEVIEVNVQPGDTVKKNQTLITLESDKASMEIPAPEPGVVEKVLLKVGDKVSQGTIILYLRTASEAKKPAETPEPPKHVAPEKTGPSEQAVHVPDIGNFKQVAVIEVNVAVGAHVKKEETLVTLESDKASMEIPSPFAGVVKSLAIKVGDKVAKGDLILTMMAEAASAPASRVSAAMSHATRAPAPPALPKARQPLREITTPGVGPLYTSPAVRRMARDLAIDLRRVPGSGRKGRIQPEDLQDYVKTKMSGEGGGLGVMEMPEINFAEFGPIETVELSRIKKLSAGYLHRNWVTIPHVTQFDEADITEMEAFRKAKQTEAQSRGVKLTPLSFLLKAVVAALKKFPQFNASLATNGSDLILKKYYHIGVAVDTPQGLVVPVLRDVDKKTLYEIAAELGEISQKARDGKLSSKELQGSTFTISSLGGVGGTAFTPIINAPDVAILGVSKSSLKPVYQEDKFIPRLLLPLSLSYDHRVLDGVDGAKFTTYLREILGNIESYL